MKKTALAVVMTIFICISQPLVHSEEIDTLSKAKIMYELGLLKGVGNTFSEENLEFNRKATRAEICTIIVRMLGKEEKANYQQNPHPFTDVPSWASNNIGWLYENYLVNGTSDTYFGAEDVATVQQFSTMLLRVLGFDDSEGDFSYDQAVQFAHKYGIISGNDINQYELSRETMIDMCYNALISDIKNSKRSLIQKLCDEGAINEVVVQSTGITKPLTISDYFPSVPENLGDITVTKQNNKFCITLKNPAEEYGLRVYVMEIGGALTELSQNGSNSYFKKGDISYSSGSVAGYVSELYVYGLDPNKKYSFIILKTTSESEFYKTLGKSTPANN